MSDPMPINFAAIEAKHGKQSAQQLLARQVSSHDRLEETFSQAFNVAAAERNQSRQDKFRTLESRVAKEQLQEAKAISASKKAAEDLARQFSRRNSELSYDRLLNLLHNLREGLSPEEILEQVAEEFQDPTLADEAFDYLNEATEGTLKESVQAAKELLFATKKREILAGRNINDMAKQYHKKGLAESPTALRDLYRDITGNPRDHNALFSELAKQYPYETLKQVLSFLFKSLGYDLKSKGPSIQQAELVRLMTDMRNLQSILWVYLFFKSRKKLMQRMFKENELEYNEALLSFEELAKEFIKLVDERYPSVLKLLKQSKRFGQAPEAQMIVLTQWRDAIRQLSTRIYRSLKHRQDLLLVLIEALEELETEEEEEQL